MNLEATSGLPVSIEEGLLAFKEGLAGVRASRRRHRDMASVLLDPPGSPGTVYLVYRGIAQPWNRVLFCWAGLRYDMTLVRPLLLGREYAKTVGHYHSAPPGSRLTYPEVYQVLSGRACFLLQRQGPRRQDTADVRVLLLEGVAGDIVVVPPGYGHVTINPSEEEPLLVANLVASEAVSLYEPMVRHKGAAFYVTPAGLRENLNYESVPAPAWVCLPDPHQVGLKKGVPLYTQFIMNPVAFDFLSQPERQEASLGGYADALQSPENLMPQLAWPLLCPGSVVDVPG
jgi:glucose-6-phosphate isomerase